MTKITTANSSRLMVTIGLCFMVALMEGLDLQAAGIAAVGMAQAFALDKMQMGWIFSAGILGLLPGALVGGMLADRHGRKRILLSSVLLFGLFSLATAVAWSFPTLLLARLLTGVGLGAALPNLIALTSEAAGPRFRGRAVSLMYCGVPIGAALAAALGLPRLSIEKFETGRQTPSQEQQQKLAGAFGVSLPYLRGETDDPTSMDNWLSGAVPQEDVVLPKAVRKATAAVVAQSGDSSKSDGAVFSALLKSDSFKALVRETVLDVLKSPEGQALLAKAAKK